MPLKKLIFFVVFSLSFSLCYSQKTDEKNKYRRIIKLIESNSWTKYFSSSGKLDIDINRDIYLEYKNLLSLGYKNSLYGSLVILNDNGSFWEFEINKIEVKKSQINYIKQLAPTYGKNETHGFSLGISSRNSYNFNLLRNLSKAKFTIGPFASLSYNFKKNAIYNSQYLQNQNLVGLDLGLITRLGYNIGKRFYLEAAVPINMIDLSYGTELINYTVVGTYRREKFQYINYFKKKSPDEYICKFEFILSLGYKF